MGSALHNLDRESILLLYLAGELPPEDRAEIEHMLAADGTLRAQYEQLLAAQQVLAGTLEDADAQQPLPAPQASSVRKVSAAMKQWHASRLARRPSQPVHHGRRLGWVWGASAVAASVLIGGMILWSRVDDGKTNPNLVTMLDNKDGSDEALVAEPAPSESVAIESVTAESDSEPPFADTQLTRAEDDLFSLSTLTDSLRTTEEAVTP